MPRGITQEDVWRACDALLLEGARPTIERVRQKLGRGSPNTVSPLLETWFRHLGARIKDPAAFSAPPALPDPVHQAAQHFWEAALAETRKDFDERLRDGLAQASSEVETQRARAAAAQAAASDVANELRHVQDQREHCAQALAQTREARAAGEAQLAAARSQIEDLRLRLDRSLAETVEVREQSGRDLAAAIERFSAAERRAALEIDAERTARGKAERRGDALEKKLDAIDGQLRALQLTSQEELAQLRAQTVAREQALQQAQNEILSLRTRLEEQAAALGEAQREAHAARLQAGFAERMLGQLQQQPGSPRRRGRLKTGAS